MRVPRTASLLLAASALLLTLGCATNPSEPDPGDDETVPRSPRLALWLAKKSELIAHESASFDLVMSGWFEPAEAEAILARRPSAKLLAGLTLTWVSSSQDWLTFLVTVANGGDPNGPLQITDDMYLMIDDNEDGILDHRCSPPGWEDEIYAMDPRHEDWQDLILAFYDLVGAQPQHDGVIVDMLDAYPFCEGAWSAGVPVPLDEDAWVDGQEDLLASVRANLPAGKWVIANAGLDLPVGSPFPQYLNGYLIENALGTQFGLSSVEELLASASRAMTTTASPHIVVYAVDTDDTGVVDPPRFRTGLVASLLADNTYFAYDYGPRDHGGVTDWWFPDHYDVDLGSALGPYALDGGAYKRDFENGSVVVAGDVPAAVVFATEHTDVATGASGTSFTVPEGDARVFLRVTSA